MRRARSAVTMNRRIPFAIALVATSLVAIGCAAGDEPTEDSESAESGLTTVSSSGGATSGTGTTFATKPSPATATCVSGCLSTRISTGWCQAYCDCRVLDKRSASECSQIASEFFIDI